MQAAFGENEAKEDGAAASPKKRGISELVRLRYLQKLRVAGKATTRGLDLTFKALDMVCSAATVRGAG